MLAGCVSSSKFGSFQHCVGAEQVGDVIDSSSRELLTLRDLKWWHICSVWPGVLNYKRWMQSFHSTVPYCIAFNPWKKPNPPQNQKPNNICLQIQ